MRRNVRKVMARLNPSSMPLVVSGSRGTGQPELTGIDIAAALAAANGDHRRRLAIDVLCLRWWPARMEGPPVVVGHREERRPLGGGKHEVIRLPIERPAETEPFVALASLVARRLSMHARQSIADDGVAAQVLAESFLHRWSRAVIEEFRNPNVCASCRHHGRPGELAKPVSEGGRVVRFEWVLCDECGGTGTVPWSKDRRAKAVKVRKATFREVLNDSHDGAILLLQELERRGERYVAHHFGEH